MARCQYCGYFLPEDRDRVGSRCPHCRCPLYIPPDRVPREVRPDEAACSVHPGSVATGTCGRCGNFVCETCRTRWNDAVVCTACLERALRAGGADSARKAGHSRRATLGLSGGLAAWLLTGGVFLVAYLVFNSMATPKDNQLATVLVGLCILFLFPAAVIIALVGLGQSAAALRTRGDSMIVATLGFLLCGLHVGAVVGIFLFEVWLR